MIMTTWTLKDLENCRTALARYEAEGEDRNGIKFCTMSGMIRTITRELREQGENPESPMLRYAGVAYFEDLGAC